MASLIVRKLTASVITLDDLGLSIAGVVGTTFDLLTEQPNDISMSTDLVAAVTGGDLEVLDPRDNTTLLSTADGVLVIQNHNLPHFGIDGGRFSDLDAPGSTPTNTFLLDYNSVTDKYEQVDPAIVVSNNQDAISSIVGNMIDGGTDTNVTYNPSVTPIVEAQDETGYDGSAPNGDFTGGDGVGGTAYAPGDTITMSDGSIITVDAVDANGDVTNFTVTTNGGNVTPGVALTQTSTTGTGTAFTITPENANIQQGSIQVNVDDSFLRNDGDNLTSGTLTVDSGATINIATGGNFTIQDDPVNPTDVVNKSYVDGIASGLDPKESVRVGTTAALTIGAGVGEWGYTNNGGIGDTLINVTASTTTVDGVILADGDRVLIKDQADATQNGIYVVSDAGAGVATTFTRAPDQDDSAGNEISGGNFTFIEQGTQSGSGWVVVHDGQLTLNTDVMNWSQFSESTSIGAGVGISAGGNDLDLDVANTLGTSNSITGADLVAFHDQDGVAAGSGSGSQTYARSWTNVLSDLNVVNNIAGTGILVQTAPGTYSSISIAVDGAGALDGLVVANGNGIGGNPTIGLDINNLPVRSDAIDITDRVAVYNVTTLSNEYYTVGELAGAVASTNSFATWAAAGNTTGDVNIVADSSSDTATLTGGRAINIDFTATTDTLTLSLAKTTDMAGTVATVAADTVLFFDASNADVPEVRTWTDIIADLGLITSITAATDEDLLGINVTSTVVGLNIDGLTNAADNMAATDEFPLHNKSEGIGGANRKMTGQEIADGTAAILNISDITVSTIGGQPILTVVDSTRGNKVLSSDTAQFNFGENSLSHLDWIRIGNASDSESGHIMPLNGTVVWVTAHCENTGSNSKDIHIFIDGVDQGIVGTLSGGANAEINNNTLNLDFTAGQKIRLRAEDSVTGRIDDTVANVFVRWRA